MSAGRFLLRRDRVVQAGAGTGKTHALVTQYLHLCAGLTAHEQALPPPQLVAMTFTEKAAGEMLERIRHRVQLLCQGTAPDALGPVEPLEPDLVHSAALLGRPLPGADHWERVLHQLGGAPIGTFHSFAGNLLRRHAAAVGIEPGFALLSEGQARELELEITERVVLGALEGALAERVPAASVAALLGEYGFRGRGEAGALVEALCAVRRRRAEEGKGAAGLAAAYEPGAQEAALQALRAGLVMGLEQLGALSGLLGEKSAALVQELVSQRAMLWQLLGQLAGVGEAARRCTELFAVLSRLRARASAEEARDYLPQLRESLRDACEGLRALQRSAEAAPLARTFEALCAEAAQAYDDAKRREGVLDFGDLLYKARDLLREHAAEREGLRARYQVFLVDEFQDTNPLQAELLLLLCGEPGSHTPGRLYLVGDLKQSIYEFRGADVATFSSWAERLVAAGGEEEIMTVSRRSQPGVLALTTVLFGQMMAAPAAQGAEAVAAPRWRNRWVPERDALRPARSAEGDGPSAELLVEAEPEAPDGEPGEPGLIDEADAADEAELCARHILALREGGWAFGSMAMLLRRFTRLGRYLQALRRAHIPHYVVKGRGLFEAAEVRDVNAALTLLMDPDDRYALVTVLRSPLCGVSDDTLARLHLAGGLRLAGLLAPPPEVPEAEALRLGRVYAVLLRLREEGERLGPVACLEALLQGTQVLPVLAASEDGEQRLGNLQVLQAYARRVELDGGGLWGFAQWLRGQCDPSFPADRAVLQAQVVSERADVVRVMTIHQAKGLEFPVVIIPGCGSRERVESGPILYDRDIGIGLSLYREGERCDTLPSLQVAQLRRWRTEAESTRLFYVAVTRARDRVIFAGSGGKRRAQTGTWRAALAQVPEVFLQRQHPAPPAPVLLPEDEADPGLARPGVEAAAQQVVDRATAPLGSGALGARRYSVAAAADLIACARRFHLRQGLRYPEAPEPLQTPAPYATLANRLLALTDLTLGGADLEGLLAADGYDAMIPAVAEIRTRVVRFLRSRFGQWLAARPRVLRALPYCVPAAGLSLSGVLDLVVVEPEQVTLVAVHYAYQPPGGPSGPSGEPASPRTQRELLGVVARGLWPEVSTAAHPVRVGLCYLREADPTPRMQEVSAAQADAVLVALQQAAQAAPLAAAEALAAAPLAPSRCQQLGCGYQGLCHAGAQQLTQGAHLAPSSAKKVEKRS